MLVHRLQRRTNIKPALVQLTGLSSALLFTVDREILAAVLYCAVSLENANVSLHQKVCSYKYCIDVPQ